MFRRSLFFWLWFTPLLAIGFTAIGVRAALLPTIDVPRGPNYGRKPAYSESAYYGPAFVKERGDFSASGALTADGFTVFPDFHGQYFNVQNNWRATTDQPANAAHRLWLFGASTVFCSEVPDSLTLPSFLQRLIGPAYRVENRGVENIDAAKELIILKQAAIQPGDLVLIYDGAPDAMAPFIRNSNPSPETLLAAQRAYARVIGQARDYTLARGAAFWHFLQPMVYSIPLQPYEDGFSPNGAAYAQSWPLFQTTPFSIDLSHSLDSLRLAGDMIYFDEAHINERGNEAVARAIYQSLKEGDK